MFTPLRRELPCARGSLPVYGTPTFSEPGLLNEPYLSGPAGTSSSTTAMGLTVSAGGAASGAMASLTGAPSELNEGDAIGRREPDFPKPAHPARRPRSRRRGGRTNERRKDSSFQGLGNWPAWFFRFPVSQPVRPRLAKTCWAGIRTRRGDKQSHQRERPFQDARAPLRTRAEAARGARSVWVDQGSPARNESVASERPSRRSTRPSPSI
mmetsp:Transcript_10234/g.42281  ORF Transcript_10234/g.42281 Transcript_10234/m.42281 type:complete len:210 (-) Transcript_10234:5385-6014(-)